MGLEACCILTIPGMHEIKSLGDNNNNNICFSCLFAMKRLLNSSRSVRGVPIYVCLLYSYFLDMFQFQ